MKAALKKTLVALLFGMLPALAVAQTTGNTFPTPTPGQTTVGIQILCLNSSGQAVPPDPATCAHAIPVSGTFSASLGGFQPSSTYATPLAVSTTSSLATLPIGATVVVYNTGSTAAYVQLGNGSAVATTASDFLAPQSAVGFVVGSNTNLAAITATGTTTLNISGGSGLPTGWGGGGGGGAAVPNPLPITASALPLPAGAATDSSVLGITTALAPAATAANQATGNASLATIATNTGNLINTNADAPGASSGQNLGTSCVYTATPVSASNGQARAVGCGILGGIRIIMDGEYPFGSTPVMNSATGTTAAVVATLPASASLKTYICGYSIRANATAAATGNATVTGTLSTLNFTQWTGSNGTALGINEQIFKPCLPSSAINTAVVVTSAAAGTGGVASAAAWGYQAP